MQDDSTEGADAITDDGARSPQSGGRFLRGGFVPEETAPALPAPAAVRAGSAFEDDRGAVWIRLDTLRRVEGRRRDALVSVPEWVRARVVSGQRDSVERQILWWFPLVAAIVVVALLLGGSVWLDARFALTASAVAVASIAALAYLSARDVRRRTVVRDDGPAGIAG